MFALTPLNYDDYDTSQTKKKERFYLWLSGRNEGAVYWTICLVWTIVVPLWFQVFLGVGQFRAQGSVDLRAVATVHQLLY